MFKKLALASGLFVAFMANAAGSSGWVKVERIDTRSEDMHIRVNASFHSRGANPSPTWGIVKTEWLSPDALNRLLSIALAAKATGTDVNLFFDGCDGGKAKITGIAIE